MKNGQRVKKIDVRFTLEEFDMILELEKRLGIRRAEIIRIRVLEHSAQLVINSGNLIDRLDSTGAELNRTGNNVNQLARYANILNKKGVLSVQVIERFNQLLAEYLDIQQKLEVSLRKIIRALGK